MNELQIGAVSAMAEAKNPTVDDLEKKEQELFRTGPLSVLTTSVKSNSQVLINCRSDGLLHWISHLGQSRSHALHKRGGSCTAHFNSITCIRQLHYAHQLLPLFDSCSACVASTLGSSRSRTDRSLHCLTTGTTESFWRASKPSIGIAT